MQSPDDRLRVSIIRGIRRDHPDWYRVIFGANPKFTPTNSGLIVMMARVHTMEPSSDDNLKAFLGSFDMIGRYVLAHCIRTGESDLEFVSDNFIGKYKLHLREAWQVSKNDLDAVGILPDDDPIIPNDQPEAPVLELLKLKRSRSPKVQ